MHKSNDERQQKYNSKAKNYSEEEIGENKHKACKTKKDITKPPKNIISLKPHLYFICN